MNVNATPDLIFGAAGGFLDGYLRQKPFAESTLTGVAIKATQLFASCIIGAIGIPLAISSARANGNWKPIAVLTSIAILASRIAIAYAAFHYGYIGNAVALAFGAIDAIGTISSCVNLSLS